jgi:hypothetical protein
VKHEPMDEFEQELRQAFERRPAPPRLKRQVMEEVRRRREAGRRSQVVWWQRIAAGVVLAAAVGGAAMWRQADERRKGVQARKEVLTALRITGRALNEVQSRLAARDRGE